MSSEVQNGDQSAQLLEKLDKLLADTDPGPNEVKSPAYGELNDPDYTKQNREYHKIANHFEKNVVFIVKTACSMLNGFPPTDVFRLCSVGCGDGMMDKEILEGISKNFPQAKVHYVGIDTNTLSCTRAKESLGSLKNVTVEIHNRDIQLSVEDIEPCDLVIGVNMIYYVSSLKSALSNITKLIKSKGQALLVIVSKNAYNELFHRFWLHENKRPVHFSAIVTEQLDEMGIECKFAYTDGIVDLTQCFKDSFKHPLQKCILSFIPQTKLERYPPLIAETCIEYLSSIAYGKPEETLIASRQDIIIINQP